MADETPVDELEGRELDAAVADEVVPRGVCRDEGCQMWGVPHFFDEGETVPEYSSDRAAAMSLTDLFDTWSVERVYDPGGPRPGDFYISAHVTRHETEAFGRAYADTPELAICRAALKAVREA